MIRVEYILYVCINAWSDISREIYIHCCVCVYVYKSCVLVYVQCVQSKTNASKE